MPKCPGMKLEKSIILTINGFQFLQVYEFWQKSNEFAIRTIEDQFFKKIYFFTILLRKPKFAKVIVENYYNRETVEQKAMFTLYKVRVKLMFTLYIAKCEHEFYSTLYKVCT